MRDNKKFRFQVRAVRERVEILLECVNRISPNIDKVQKRDLVDSMLRLLNTVERKVPPRRISDGQAVAMVWEHSQCVHSRTGKCPLLIFGRELAGELNAFFSEED
jgi:hypothetical protein